jgi:undecaprenyl-diphosphatase
MMTSLVSSIIELLTVNPHIAYLAVFLLALCESIPIIGAVVPGTAVILALSALVPSGVLLLWPLLIAATSGAIVSDGLSFWLGRRYHREILGFWPLNRHPELIQSSEAFFERHGAMSVFFARFVPGVRAFIPLFAGMMGMAASRFYAVNVTSAFAWALSHILSGVLAGATFRLLGAAAKPLAILLVVLLATGWALLHIVRWALRHGVPFFIDALRRLRSWAGTHDTRLSRGVTRLLDPSRPEARTLALSAVLLVGAAWLFFGILEDVVTGDPLLLADSAIFHALQDLRTAPGDAVMIAITELGDTLVVVAVTTAVLLWLLWKRAWRTAIYWLVAITGASVLNTIIKVALHRARPGELLYSGWSAFSFLSGHSTVNFVLYGFLAFLIAREIRPAWRLVVILGAATLVFLIAFSRLYLGAHWLSDVLGGMAFGSAWLALLSLSYLKRQAGRIDSMGLFAVGGLALILAGGLNVYRSHATDSDRYAIKSVEPSMTTTDWWASGWEQLPARRIDLTGETNEPLTFQWAGGLTELRDVLQRNGWRDSAAWTPLSAMNWLSIQTDSAALPVIPLFASGRLPSLTLIRANSDGALTSSRLVLRVWVVDFELTNGRSSALWMGSVVEERFYHPLSLVTLTSTQPGMNAPRGTLASVFDNRQLLPRPEGTANGDWDGNVLLARHGKPQEKISD